MKMETTVTSGGQQGVVPPLDRIHCRCIDENYLGLRWTVDGPRSEAGPTDSEADGPARHTAHVSLTTTTTSSLVTLQFELDSARQVALLVSLRPSLWPHPPEGLTKAIRLSHGHLL